MKLNVANKAEWGELRLALDQRHEILKQRLRRATVLSRYDVEESCIKRLGAIATLRARIGGEQHLSLPGEPI